MWTEDDTRALIMTVVCGLLAWRFFALLGSFRGGSCIPESMRKKAGDDA